MAMPAEQHLEQGSPEWHKARSTRIGGSDVASIKGISPFKSAYSLMLEKVHGTKTKDTASMKYGRDNEEKARQLFIQETGLAVFPDVRICHKHDWKIASADGVGDDCLVELKWPNKEVFEQAKKGIVVDYYYCQLQHNLEVFDIDQGYFFCAHGNTRNPDTALVSVKRDPKYIAEMHVELLAFWEMWQKGQLPAMTADDHQLMDSEAWDTTVQRFLRIKGRLNDLEAEEKACKEVLLELAAGRNAIGSGIKLTRSVRKGSVDYGRIPALEGIDLEPYRKDPSTVWTINET